MQSVCDRARLQDKGVKNQKEFLCRLDAWEARSDYMRQHDCQSQSKKGPERGIKLVH